MSSRPIYERRSFRSREAVGALIGLTRKAIIEQLDDELSRHGVSAAQSLVLLVVADWGAGTAAEACKRLSHDPGAMTRLLDRLEAKGLLRRVRGEGDRRSARLELTPKGRQLHGEINAAQVAVFNRLLSGFTRAEARQLEGFLKRMLANS
jgi:MarR family multiple antibiotic resistance transcriptional regulator